MLAELSLAFGLVLFIEGLLYGLFPDGMKRMIEVVAEQPSSVLRTTGLAIAVLGLGIVWMERA